MIETEKRRESIQPQDAAYNFALRTPVASDAAFVMQTWLKHYREQSFNRLIPRAMYFPEERKRIERLLGKANITIICNPDEPAQIFGWVAWSQILDLFIVHYCYTRRSFRKLGLMRNALHALYPRIKLEEIACTRLTKEVLEMGLKDSYRAKFNPYLEEIVCEN